MPRRRTATCVKVEMRRDESVDDDDDDEQQKWSGGETRREWIEWLFSSSNQRSSLITIELQPLHSSDNYRRQTSMQSKTDDQIGRVPFTGERTN